MPKIKIEKVISFSSEDPTHPASNLIVPDPGKKWKCAKPGEKNASVILQLEKATQIASIDIGNEGSAYIEVLVSRASSEEYKVLLGMSAFMTASESRQNQNVNQVRMFASKDFSSPECDEKWDRVKVVCIQPYNKHFQYGLSFITIHTNEGSKLVEKKAFTDLLLRPDSPNAFAPGSLFAKEKEGGLSTLQGKDHQWLGAVAIREASKNPSLLSSPYKSPLGTKLKRLTSAQSDEVDSSGTVCNRNRSDLLYDEDDGAPNAKIDKLIENKKKEQLKNEEQIKHKAKEETSKEVKKRRTGGDVNEENETPKKRRNDDIPSTSTTNNPVPVPAETKATPIQSPTAIKETPKEIKKRRTGGEVNEENETPKTRRNEDIPSTSTTNNPLPAPTETKKPPIKSPAAIKPKHARKPFERLLEGVVFVISGIQNPERASLRSKALALGAKYKPDWNDSCTHLICAFANTPKFIQVRGKGKIVKKQWITECASTRRRIPWRRFALDPRDQTGEESEEEIWEQCGDQRCFT